MPLLFVASMFDKTIRTQLYVSVLESLQDGNIRCNAHLENCFIPGGSPGLKQSHLWEHFPVLSLDGHNFSHCIVDCRSIVLKVTERCKSYLFLYVSLYEDL